jgi:hypothetical protein
METRTFVPYPVRETTKIVPCRYPLGCEERGIIARYCPEHFDPTLTEELLRRDSGRFIHAHHS